MTEQAKAIARGPSWLLAIMMTAGILFAAYRAWIWPDRVRARQIVVTASEQTSISIKNGPEPSDVTRGVHAWMLEPGPITLVITADGDRSAEVSLEVPKGLGTLMLDVKFDDQGELQLGYF